MLRKYFIRGGLQREALHSERERERGWIEVSPGVFGSEVDYLGL